MFSSFICVHTMYLSNMSVVLKRPGKYVTLSGNVPDIQIHYCTYMSCTTITKAIAIAEGLCLMKLTLEHLKCCQTSTVPCDP